MKITPQSARRVVRASAVYDLIASAGFALPWTVAGTFALLDSLHRAFGLTGAVPDADATFTVLFANLTGSLVVVWSVVRIWRPTLAFGAADTVARVLFSTAMLSALGSGASPVVLAFLVPELTWAVVQGGAVALASGRRTLAA
ncbi:hypothetical protein QI633_10900 [Nocardioides sp. QY071]|uniref:hypothetical protein n=1 Tax=Nocardioides sp. QY071 TaxID=3044187 RepID=UPI00249C1FFB|nr:hypothetical protein [Nocardioides sp. QY071]WGY04257.1 hypothetical protein QI633_10900 [Nocardioides sp. QY071]